MLIHGQGVSKGVAIGKMVFFDRAEPVVERKYIENETAEILRFEKAKNLAVEQLGELAFAMKAKIGEENAVLFEIHQMMLEDADYLDCIKATIESHKVCAEYAVNEASAQFSEMFATMDDDYMRERAADIVDVSRRVITILADTKQEMQIYDEPVILISDDFTPSETAQLERDKVLALATLGGSGNSHTAILPGLWGFRQL